MTGSYGRVVVNFSDCSKVNKIFGNEIRKYSNYFTQSRRRGSCKNCDCMLIKEFIVRRAKLICFFFEDKCVTLSSPASSIISPDE